MSLLASYIVPHPPLAVPQIGHGDERRIQATLDGYKAIAERIASIGPDVIIVISPHTAYYSDWVFMAGGKNATGSLAQFGAPEVRIRLNYDTELRAAIECDAQAHGIRAGAISDDSQELDHGVMVPMSFIDEAYPSSFYRAVSIGGSALPHDQLVEFGRCITRAAEQLDRRCILLVSGDLSHKLKEDGPYGFDAAGPEFDAAFVRTVESGDAMAFAALDPRMCENAAECGLSGFVMMAGALAESEEITHIPYTSQLLSYEGPFGVGYGVAAYERADSESVGTDGTTTQVEAEDDAPAAGAADAPAAGTVAIQDAGAAPDTTVASSATADQAATGSETASDSCGSCAPGDALVNLAWDTVRLYVSEHTLPDIPALPADVPAKAGCFVSIHVASTDDLRGCIGTIEPVQESLAEEIIANAVSAATRDPRFPPIMPSELDNLRINVDVLFEPEPATIDDLNPKRYGVIVTQGYKRGLLLPDLDGVDTVEEQVRIACLKAGIDRADPSSSIQLERFEVVRHE